MSLLGICFTQVPAVPPHRVANWRTRHHKMLWLPERDAVPGGSVSGARNLLAQPPHSRGSVCGRGFVAQAFLPGIPACVVLVSKPAKTTQARMPVPQRCAAAGVPECAIVFPKSCY